MSAGNPVLEYVEYPIDSPFWWIRELQQNLERRDIKGATGGKIEAIKVSAQHPLVLMTGAFLASENANPSVAGIIPGISVMEGSETEENTTMGRGTRADAFIDTPYLDQIQAQYPKMEDRTKEGILTDTQIETMRVLLNKYPKKRLRAAISHLWFRDSVMISLWTHSVTERVLIGNILRSAVFDTVNKLSARNVRDPSLRADKGLVNMNFGRILEGQEIEVSFQNWIRTVQVFDAAPLVDSINMDQAIRVTAKYVPVTTATTKKGEGVVIWEPEKT